MLKLAIIRVHDDDLKTAGRKDILLEAPLAEWLAEEVRSATIFGFRKRHVRKSVRALARIEQRIKQETIHL